MMTRLEVKEILSNWEKGLTNLQISEKMNLPVKKIILHLNRYNKKSNRYEIIDESKIEQLLIGSYLGDGHFTKKGSKGAQSRLQLIHSKKQLEYLLWKVDKLKSVNLSTVLSTNISTTRIGNKSTTFCMKSKPHPMFSRFRDLGYDDYSFCINLELIKNINEEGFSIWYFDDGSVTNDGVTINCTRIPYEEKEKLKQLILKNLNLEVNITPDTLYVPKNQMSRFLEIVTPFCLESMKYKLLPYHQRGAHLKSDKLLEHPEEDNQQPS